MRLLKCSCGRKNWTFWKLRQMSPCGPFSCCDILPSSRISTWFQAAAARCSQSLQDTSRQRYGPFNETRQLVERGKSMLGLAVILWMKVGKWFWSTGILVVVTPDSKHQQKNMKMIRSWQEAFNQLGFERISYAKHDHLHCLAFRKLCEISRSIVGHKSGCEHDIEQVSCVSSLREKFSTKMPPHQ